MDITIEDLASPGKVVQLGFEPNRIDLMTSLTAVSFEEAWESRISATLEGVPVQFIGRRALITNKEATGRSKDLVDADELRRMESLE